jgi:hypothetical protein
MDRCLIQSASSTTAFCFEKRLAIAPYSICIREVRFRQVAVREA